MQTIVLIILLNVHLPYILLDLFTFFPSTETDGATHPTAGRHAFVTVALQQLVDERKEICKRLATPLAGRHPHQAETPQHRGPRETLHDARARDLKTVKNLHEETRQNAHQHWLPIQERITFKLLLITFKEFQTCTAIYIWASCWIFCSNSAVALKVPPTHIKAFRDGAFAKVARLLWDNLLQSARQRDTISLFKIWHLFKIAFNT